MVSKLWHKLLNICSHIWNTRAFQEQAYPNNFDIMGSFHLSRLIKNLLAHGQTISNLNQNSTYCTDNTYQILWHTPLYTPQIFSITQDIYLGNTGLCIILFGLLSEWLRSHWRDCVHRLLLIYTLVINRLLHLSYISKPTANQTTLGLWVRCCRSDFGLVCLTSFSRTPRDNQA